MKPRRWFRFSLRTFFVLLTLAACAAWWVQVQLKWIHDRHDVLMQHMHWVAGYPPWSLRLFGEPGISTISAPDAQQARVQELFPEAEVTQIFIPDNSGDGGWSKWLNSRAKRP